MMPTPSSSRPAKYWTPVSDNRVECTLCPRHCRPKNDRMGYCGVRGTVDGALHTFNYGKSLPATEEVIETEAINHFSPGARILSMGNIGCMMSCAFCQNWETSQIKHLNPQVVRHYSPQQVVDLCVENDIDIISWTYNDPVVWHEFVVETSILAQQHGLKTLYKSAFYIEEQPTEELIACIDIFSLSLKSMSERFYQKITRAKLGPILERIKQVAQSNRHLEISQLVIPELNDSDEDIIRTINWVLENVGDQVPLHFVAFHPAYKYKHVERTDIATLKRARQLAQEMGMRYVYLGNTHETNLNDTHCYQCDALLVRRFGLIAEPVNIDQHGCCTQCQTPSPIVEPLTKPQQHIRNIEAEDFPHQIRLHWDSEIQSAHVMLTSQNPQPDTLRIRPLGPHPMVERKLEQGLDRFIISRQSAEEKGVVISWCSNQKYEFFPVLDRAHFPVEPESTKQDISVRLSRA